MYKLLAGVAAFAAWLVDPLDAPSLSRHLSEESLQHRKDRPLSLMVCRFAEPLGRNSWESTSSTLGHSGPTSTSTSRHLSFCRTHKSCVFKCLPSDRHLIIIRKNAHINSLVDDPCSDRAKVRHIPLVQVTLLSHCNVWWKRSRWNDLSEASRYHENRPETWTDSSEPSCD